MKDDVPMRGARPLRSRGSRLRAGIGAGLAACAVAAATSSAAFAADVQPFTVSPPTVSASVPTSATSYPFAADGFDARFPLPPGYEVHEYFISGNANIYEYTPTGIRVVAPCPASVTGSAQPACSDLPYTTRMLVYAPKNRSRFSGTVWVNPMNPTFNADYPVIWDRAYEPGTRTNNFFARENDIFVAWTSKSVAVDFLKQWNPTRYGALNWPYTPASPGANNAPYDGITFDIASQVGALLRLNGSDSPVHDYDVKRVFEAGFSQDGGFTFTQADIFHGVARLPGDREIYQGYVPEGLFGGASASLNFGLTPAGTMSTSDPRAKMVPRSAPVIKLNTETEIDGFGSSRPVYWHRADSDAPNDRYREWEVGAASHDDVGDLLTPGNLSLIGQPYYDYAGCDHVRPPYTSPTDYPFGYVANAAYAALGRWVDGGPPPARVPRLQQTDLANPTKATMQRDAFGNPLGGVRTPYLDVPVATYSVIDTPAAYGCTLNGWSEPLSPDTLRQLYPSHGAYVGKFVQAALKAVGTGVWLKEDARLAIERATHAPVP